jgi:hypothetical protein
MIFTAAIAYRIKKITPVRIFTRYDIEACVIGGSNGQSDWTAAVNYMAN